MKGPLKWRGQDWFVCSQYEKFNINEPEIVDDMITCFTQITNRLSSLGDSIENYQKVRKVIRALSQSWEVKSTTLKELNVKKDMDFM